MYKINEKISVYQNRSLVGKGIISDICKNEFTLKRYFNHNHPKFMQYFDSIQKGKWIYIVDFDYDMGQGGYLEKDLKKNNLDFYIS